MEEQRRLATKIGHARQVERFLMWLGWTVGALGVIGIMVFLGLWLNGDLTAEQAFGVIFGSTLATILSGATIYGSGVNVGLGAERLELTARGSASPTRKAASAGDPSSGELRADGTQ